MPQIRLSQLPRYTSSGGSIGTVTIAPATAGTATADFGFSTTTKTIAAGAKRLSIYNAGMASGGGVPAIVDVDWGGIPRQIEEGQPIEFEAIHDPVTNIYEKAPAITITCNGSTVFYKAFF